MDGLCSVVRSVLLGMGAGPLRTLGLRVMVCEMKGARQKAYTGHFFGSPPTESEMLTSGPYYSNAYTARPYL